MEIKRPKLLPVYYGWAKTVSKYLRANFEWAKNEADRRYGRKEAVCGSV